MYLLLLGNNLVRKCPILSVFVKSLTVGEFGCHGSFNLIHCINLIFFFLHLFNRWGLSKM